MELRFQFVFLLSCIFCISSIDRSVSLPSLVNLGIAPEGSYSFVEHPFLYFNFSVKNSDVYWCLTGLLMTHFVISGFYAFGFLMEVKMTHFVILKFSVEMFVNYGVLMEVQMTHL